MAYGIYCSVCGGTVDNNEFNFAKDMCKECASEQEQEENMAEKRRNQTCS